MVSQVGRGDGQDMAQAMLFILSNYSRPIRAIQLTRETKQRSREGEAADREETAVVQRKAAVSKAQEEAVAAHESISQVRMPVYTLSPCSVSPFECSFSLCSGSAPDESHSLYPVYSLKSCCSVSLSHWEFSSLVAPGSPDSLRHVSSSGSW